MSSNYPDGAEKDPRAPWNQKEQETQDCPDCEGFGHHLSSRGTCRTCDGSGQIEVSKPEKDEDYYEE